jgi:outer membrane biogenesis lipoprotein LolB
MLAKICARLLLAASAAALLTACTSHERKDTLGYAAGDAVAWNRATHTIDPWPPYASNTNIPVSARRVAAAIERYEAGPEAASGPAPIGIVPVAPIPPGAAP